MNNPIIIMYYDSVTNSDQTQVNVEIKTPLPKVSSIPLHYNRLLYNLDSKLWDLLSKAGLGSRPCIRK